MFKKIYFLIVILLMALSIKAQQIKGKVVSVSDGDTFTLLVDGKYQVKIRLHGVDCPEKSQSFGKVAKKFTSDKVFGKTIIVKTLDIDRYGRTIAMVYLPNKNTLNELLLLNGLAWHYKRYDQNEHWNKIEKNARNNKVGLWKESNPIAPWDFRRY